MSTKRLSRSCLPLLAITILGASLAAFLPGPERAGESPRYAPAVSDAIVEQDLHAGCRHLVDLIEADTAHAAWAVARLRQAVAATYIGPAIQAVAHRGLARACRDGIGTTQDAVAAAAHLALSHRLHPTVVVEERFARR